MARLLEFIGKSLRAEFENLIHKNKIILSNSVMLVAFAALIGVVYMTAYLEDFDTYILDLDQSSTSRIVVEQFNQSTDFDVSLAASYDQVESALKTGEKSVAVVIPDGFSKAVKSGAGDELLFMVDGTNYIIANSAYARGSKILGTINAGMAIKTLEGKGMMPAQAEKMVQSIGLKARYLNNPSMGYNTYLGYGLLTAGIFSLLLSGLAIVIIRENQKGLVNGETLRFKMVFYSLYIALVSVILYLFLGWVFKLPLRGNLIHLMLELMVFGCLVVLLAIIVAFVAREDYRVFQISVFLATPMIFITGFTWNYESMHWLVKGVYYICPITPMINAARAVLVNDCGLGVFIKYFVWQLGLVVVYGALAMWVYRRRKVLET